MTILVPTSAIYSIVPATRVLANIYRDPDAAAAALGARWIPLQAFEWSLAAAIAGSWAYIGWRMFTQSRWQSVQLTIAGLWFTAPLWRTVKMFGGNALRDTQFDGRMKSDLIGHSIEPAVWAAIWTAYLLRSRRVENTYARHPASDGLAEVFD